MSKKNHILPNKKKIGIIGLGYVGLPLAIEFGKIRNTIGYDIDKKRISKLSNGEDTTLEVSNEGLKSSCFLKFSSNSDDIKDCDVFIITVPTPIDHVNRPDLSFIKSATELVGKYIKKNDIVIYESTTYPGCTEEFCVPILERVSKLKFNSDFFCGYSPERINPGDKENTITKIVKIVSGSTPQITDEINILYSEIIKAGTFVASSIRVAEAAKVIENTQRDINIALINELSVIFGKLGIDTSDVLDAAESKWNFLPFKPGLVGGHCIGVDPYYLTHKAEEVGYNPQVILAGRRINDNMASYLVKKFVQLMINNNLDINNSRVGVMGVTFKENCPDIRNSKIFNVISELQAWGVNVVISDPWADPKLVKKECGLSLEQIGPSNRVDALMVAVGHIEYRNLSPHILKSYFNSDIKVLADVKSLYSISDLDINGFKVFRL